MRYLLALMAVCATMLSTGCASFTAPAYSADYSAIDMLKRSGVGKASVGNVQPDIPTAKVNQVSLRGNPLTAGDTTFAGYVGRALSSDLRDAGLLDPNSPRRIDLMLLQNEIDISGFSEGKGVIEVELKISNAGRTLLQKKYLTQTTFASSFVGATAIPAGQREYPNLVRALLSDIYRDPAFLQALRAQ
jgi:hypothetical protein